MDRAIIEKLIDKCLCKRVLPVSGAATCGQGHKTSTYLYKFREACEHFVLLLDGSPLIVEAGQEKTEFIAKQFDFFGVKALLGKTFLKFQKLLDVQGDFWYYDGVGLVKIIM